MSVWIDNRPVTSIAGARPVRLSGFLTAPRGQRSTSGVPGRLAPVVGGLQAPEPRRATLTLRIPLATIADRPAAMATVEAALAGAIRSIRTADRPGVHTRCIADAIVWSEQPNAPGMTIPSLLCDVVWLAIDGGTEDWPADPPVLLGTTRTPIPMGSIPSGGWLFIWGSTSPVTITYTPANGTGATTCVITQTVATGEHLAGDLDTGDIWLVTASARTRVSTVGGELPVLDPADALGTVLPSLQLSTGTGLLVPSTRFRL
ncbi:MAG: hypothetical protein HEQ38_20595 [Gemmatimonas sp.]|nr:hypothetical protein [Gemmatimonas sp.]